MDFASFPFTKALETMGVVGIVFLIAVVAVAFFVVGMSLTQLIKGHPIDSEIGTNRHMRARGIRCTAGAFRKEEQELRQNRHQQDSSTSSCGACTGESDGQRAENCSSCSLGGAQPKETPADIAPKSPCV